MTATSTFMLVVHETVAVREPDGGLITWKIKVRMVAVVPESVPGINVPLTPPKLAVIPVAVLASMVTMIIAARFVPLPMTNAGVVTVVAFHWKFELTLLSNVTVPCAVTVSATVVVCVREPLTPVIVTVEVPVGVLALVVTERVDVVAAGFGVKLPLAPLGSPLTLRVTWPVKAPIGLIVTP